MVILFPALPLGRSPMKALAMGATTATPISPPTRTKLNQQQQAENNKSRTTTPQSKSLQSRETHRDGTIEIVFRWYNEIWVSNARACRVGNHTADLSNASSPLELRIRAC
jgi:hypothetical protein